MNKFEQAREYLLDDLRSYLVGPVEGEQELIPEKASDRYHVGILWPSGTEIAQEEDDISDETDVGGGEAKSGDGVFALANASQQSAMGFTFQLPEGVPIIIEATWADYIAQEKGEPDKSVNSTSAVNLSNPPEPVEGREPRKQRKVFIWKRIPAKTGPIILPSQAEYSRVPQKIWSENEIELVLLERRIEGVRVLTITLVSRRKRPQRGQKNSESDLPKDLNVYQVSLKVRPVDGSAVFMARPRGQYVSDPEFLVHELLYRNVRQFAVGHGCAVDWTIADPKSSYAAEIRTEWVPATQVYKASSEVKVLASHPALSLEFYFESDRK